MIRDVQLPGTVTAFAAGIGRSFFSGSNALEMRVFVEPEPDIGVAGLADHASDVSVLCRIGG